MRNLIVRFCRKALSLLGLGGAISACGVFIGPDMYGTPTMEYRVSGKVTDSQTGNPIPGIEVESFHFLNGPQKVLTSDNGEFYVESLEFPSDEVMLKFSDIDGPLNGEYESLEYNVRLEKVKDGSGAWDDGDYAAENVIVPMQKKTDVE